jgi:hypothetical protein
MLPFEVIHKPTQQLGLVFMSHQELYSLNENHYIMVYLDVNCEIKPTVVRFGDLELYDHIEGPPTTRRNR